MTNHKFFELLKAVTEATSLTEAVCGKRFIKREATRLKALSPEAEMEVWLGVHNEILPEEKVFSTESNNALARSSFVKDEIQHILDQIKEVPESTMSNLDERVRKILQRKVNRINRIAKQEIFYVEH